MESPSTPQGAPDPEVLHDRGRARVAALLVVGVATAWAASEGLLTRDLTGDELGTLGRDVDAMLDRAIEVHRPESFSAHLPLAWLARAAVQELIPPTEMISWRLHTAIAVVLGALATTWLVARRERAWVASACGLLVGLSPILTFHARDSTNYAFVPLTGALVLAGLADLAEGKRGAALVLLAGLGLGCANDYYFAFFALPALLMTPVAALHAPDRRRALKAGAATWGILAAALAYPALAFWNRLRITEFDRVIARHADPDVTRFGSVRELLEPQLGRLAVAFQEGFEGLALRDAEVGTAAWVVLTTAVVLACVGKRPLERLAAGLFVGTLLATVAFEYTFNQRFDRAFPVFARNWLTVLPAMAVVQVAMFRRLRWGAAPFLLALVLLHGGSGVSQQRNVSDARSRLMDRMLRHWQPGDAGLTALPLDVVLPARLGPAFARGECLPTDWTPPRRVWRWESMGMDEITPLRRCDGTDPGYRPRLAEDGYTPPHQYKTNSHLVPIRLTLFELGDAPARETAWSAHLTPRSPLERPAQVQVVWETRHGDVAGGSLPWAPRVELGVPPPDARRARLTVLGEAVPSLLRAFARPGAPQAQYTELPPLVADPLDARIEQPIWAGRSPTVRAVRTALRSTVRVGARLAMLVFLLQALGWGIGRIRARATTAPT